jgi:hypothetical protein
MVFYVKGKKPLLRFFSEIFLRLASRSQEASRRRAAGGTTPGCSKPLYFPIDTAAMSSDGKTAGERFMK